MKGRERTWSRDAEKRKSGNSTHLAVLEVFKQDVEPLALLAVVLHDNARAANNLARVTLTIDLAKAGPGTEDLGITNLEQEVNVWAV